MGLALCRWKTRADTELTLAHFRRHREGGGERRSELAVGGPRKPSGTDTRPPGGTQGQHGGHGVDYQNPVARLMSKVCSSNLGGPVTQRAGQQQGELTQLVIKQWH